MPARVKFLRSGDLGLIWRVLVSARGFTPHVLALFLLTLLATPFALLTPVPLKIAIDSGIDSKPLPGFMNTVLPFDVSGDGAILLAAVMFVLVHFLSQVRNMAASVLRTYTTEKLTQDFRIRLFRQVQHLSFAYHDSRGTSDSIYRIQYDATSLSTIVLDSVMPMFTAWITLVSMLYVIFDIDWQLSIVALTVVPFLLGVLFKYRKKLRQQSRDAKKLDSAAMGVLQETLSALRVVKAFSQEERETQRFAGRSTESVRAKVHLALSESFFGTVVGLITAVGTAAVLYVGFKHVQSGSLTLGSLLIVMSYLGQLYDPLRTLSKRTASLQTSLAGAERAMALLDEEPDVPERRNARLIDRARGRVDFEAVSFSYVPERTVLRKVSFGVRPGERVGVVGATGVGKTTLINMLCRFFDPLGGAIYLDFVDLRDYKLRDLRNQFAIVLQEPVLFSTSIAENIAYGKPSATHAEVVAAAKAANAHDFISRFPGGYDSVVGERGMKLSGGERQRISLARAFLKDAPILVMDEPTSSVDTKTEAQILEAMDRLMEGRTVFIISHRKEALEGCDRILRIEDGSLVADEPRTAAGRAQPADEIMGGGAG